MIRWQRQFRQRTAQIPWQPRTNVAACISTLVARATSAMSADKALRTWVEDNLYSLVGAYSFF